MRKRVKLITVLIIAVALVACALLLMDNLDQQIDSLKADVKQAEVALRVAQQEQSEIKTEISNMNKDSYIIARARELGYLMPGEIRFVVVNPEVLGDDPGAAVVEEMTEE
ncbi:MAG: septum formation initiator family protein [Clostridia bacterium]|nr:septum formation initiator family protein [Clostridia bacterium]